MKSKLFFAIGIACIAAFSSCKKDEDDDNNQTTTSPENPMPTPSDADGVCVSIKSSVAVEVPSIGTQTTVTGLAVAAFPGTGDSFIDAGNVTCNGSALSKFENNSYAYTPDASNPLGLSFSSQNDWSVAGGGGITGFTYSNGTNIPTIGKLTAPATVDVGSDLNLGIDMSSSSTQLNNPDSIYFGVYGPDGNLFVAKAGTTTSHTFTAGDLGTVGTGSGYVQIAAVKFNKQTLSGQTIYFINEGVMTNSVTFE